MSKGRPTTYWIERDLCNGRTSTPAALVQEPPQCASRTGTSAPAAPESLSKSLKRSAPLSAPRERTPAAPPKADPTTGHAVVVAAYFAAFERVRGVRPSKFGAREGASVKELIAKVGGVERAIEIIDSAFQDPWFARQDINVIVACRDRVPVKPRPTDVLLRDSSGVAITNPLQLLARAGT